MNDRERSDKVVENHTESELRACTARKLHRERATLVRRAHPIACRFRLLQIYMTNNLRCYHFSGQYHALL